MDCVADEHDRAKEEPPSEFDDEANKVNYCDNGQFTRTSTIRRRLVFGVIVIMGAEWSNPWSRRWPYSYEKYTRRSRGPPGVASHCTVGCKYVEIFGSSGEPSSFVTLQPTILGTVGEPPLR